MAFGKFVIRALSAVGALGVLLPDSGFQALASPHVEEQKPMADPVSEDEYDSIWASSPLYEKALGLMKESPLIDTHIDLPQVIRSLGKLIYIYIYVHIFVQFTHVCNHQLTHIPDRHPLSILPDLATHIAGHIDIPRLRQGHLGGAFWTVWAPCPDFLGVEVGDDYTIPNDGLRDALEILDLINGMIASHPEHLQYARSSADIMSAFRAGRVPSLLGLEGTHFLGNSLSTVRLLAQLGVRYVSLTHMCHSAFASSSGFGRPMAPSGHEGGGLSALGRALVAELNRLGVLVDLSHAADETARQAVALSRAPVVWTHSVARALHDHPRNVPDDVLALIGDGPGRNPGVVQCVMFPAFVGPTPETANVSRLADHIEYIAGIVGRKHVGIGSDFDGMYASVKGLEDASKYPNLVSGIITQMSVWLPIRLTDRRGEDREKDADRAIQT